MRKFGLIGFPLSHSFSKKYFTEKFEKEGIQGAQYELYPLESIDALPGLLKEQPELVGLNVTIPYKQVVIPFLDELDEKAAAIGAVNTILIRNGKLKGYNTDYHGFKDSLLKWLGANPLPENALVLGTGGASKAVEATLKDLNISYQMVSRNPKEGQLSYTDLNTSTLVHRSSSKGAPQHLSTEASAKEGTSTRLHLRTSTLVVNTTPLGMSPHTEAKPELPYEQLTEGHFLYDLVYNPLVTAFMQEGINRKCWVKNGLEMLHGQAEKAWEIWNS